MKVLFLGDPHFDSQTPISRIDDYAETSIRKLGDIRKLALDNGVSHIMTTGDFFDKVQVSFAYLNNLVQELKKFKEDGLTVWSSIGNHDLPYNNMSYFKNTPLNILFKSGLVNHIERVNAFDTFNVYGIDFTEHEEVKNIELETDKTSILVQHYATENTVPGESIDLKDIEHFDFVVSGHDHAYYKPLTLKTGCTVLRPGSLLRRTKEEYNLSRDIVLYLFDSEKEVMKEVKLPNVKPAKEIFKDEVFDNRSINLYDNNYNDLFNEEYFASEASDIFSILSSNILPVTVNKESKDAIRRYLKEQGITES